MLQNFATCNICQSEIWPWSSEPGTVKEENSLQHTAIYPWTDNTNTDIPPDDPYQFEKYIQNQKSPEKKIELLSKALRRQIERTIYIDNTCRQMVSDKVISNKIRDIMKDKILKLEEENGSLYRMIQKNSPQHLVTNNPQTTNMASTRTTRRNTEKALYSECMKQTSR